MTASAAILALMLIRLVVRMGSERPPRADSGSRVLNAAAIVVHWGLYLTVIAMAVLGLALAMASGLPAIVFGGSGEPLPADFHTFPPRIVHGILANVLKVLILAHIAGFLYHQFILDDGLIKRMWFGSRRI